MTKPIYIQIKAGLGNQMFQYAFGRALSLRKNKELVLDISWYENQSIKDTYREYLLNKYNIEARLAISDELSPFRKKWKMFIRKVLRRLEYKKDHVYNPKHANSDGKYFEGHWSNEKYFKEFSSTIQNDLKLKNPLSNSSQIIQDSIMSLKTENKIPVSIHVRRGDCVTNPHAASYQGTVDTSYYDEARDYIFSKYNKDNIVFFVFSDDIEWVKENIVTHVKTIYVSNSDIPDYEELHLMTICSHHIIANSSYSWWGAWLNPNLEKIVIAPKRWLKDTSFDTSDVCPKEWIRM